LVTEPGSQSEFMRAIRLVFLLLGLAAAVAPALAGAADVDKFVLKLTLMDPGATIEVQTRVTPGEPFEYSEMRNGAKITMRGDLAPKVKDSYHLRLTIAEWRDEKTNSTESYEVDLVPGKAEARGFVSSFIFHRIILLTRVPDNAGR
jgi:hypothetical protein